MKYFTYTNEAGRLTFGSGPSVPDGANEISEAEYNEIMRKARTGQNVS